MGWVASWGETWRSSCEGDGEDKALSWLTPLLGSGLMTAGILRWDFWLSVKIRLSGRRLILMTGARGKNNEFVSKKLVVVHRGEWRRCPESAALLVRREALRTSRERN